MSMRSLVKCIIAAVATMCLIGACVPLPDAKPFSGTLPNDTHLDMAGAFAFMADGELRLALARPCTVQLTATVNDPGERVPCTRSVLDRIRVIALTPWNQSIAGTWSDAGHLVFRIDWKRVELDPLADDAASIVARPWTVSGTQWQPSAEDAQGILKRIGDATETQIAIAKGGPPPKLEVSTIQFEGEILRAGDPSTLVIAIANRGPGTAYRVVAITRSSIDALHGHRLSFGSIEPGAAKMRKVQLKVPASEPARDTMLVVSLSEGNGYVPPNASRRIPIAPSAAAPVLAVRCTVVGRGNVERPDLDAGQQVNLRCVVTNSGNAAAQQVELEVSVGGAAPARSAPQAIAAAKYLAFDVPLVVPRTLPIDDPVEMSITVRDRASARSARTTIVGVVRKPKLCLPGQLTRAQYQEKVTSLRTALSDKMLTQAEFDRYDAELVACLK